MIKYLSTLFLIAAVLIFLSNFALATLPAATTPVVSGGVITSASYNDILYAIGDTATSTASSIIYLLTNTNSNNIAYTGRLTITNASTTNFSLISSGSFNLNATGTMQGFAFCTSGNGACSSSTPDPLTLTKLTATNASFTNATSSASLFIPFALIPSLTAQGQIVINTTAASTSLRFQDSSATRALYDIQPRTITIASSTLAAGGGATGTSTIPLGLANRAETWTTIACYTDTGTAGIKFGDGAGNYMTFIPVSTTVSNTTVSSNNTFTYLEKQQVQIGSGASSPNYITCTISRRQDAD